MFTSLEEAERELEALNSTVTWGGKYPTVYQFWHRHGANIIPLFEYPQEIRRVIYTTNAIESLNSAIRKAIKNRQIFPSDKSTLKTVI